MLDASRHKTILVTVLKAMYDEPRLRSVLGFKGGTAAYLFYNLPRMSVDLDFDLLDESKKDLVLEKIPKLLQKMGNVQDTREKRFTLFFLLSYQKGMRGVKIEISKRPHRSVFEVKQYLGIPVLVMCKEDMAAGKLSALLTRKHFASRDMFDLWFFLKNGWIINGKKLQEETGFPLKNALEHALEKVNDVSQNQLLQGLGELVDEKQKYWIRNKLKNELIFQLKLYREAHT